MEFLALGATLIFALIVAGAWTFYRLDTASLRVDWRQVGMLALGHAALVAAIITLFVVPTALPVIIGGTLAWGLSLAVYVFGRST